MDNSFKAIVAMLIGLMLICMGIMNTSIGKNSGNFEVTNQLSDLNRKLGVMEGEYYSLEKKMEILESTIKSRQEKFEEGFNEALKLQYSDDMKVLTKAHNLTRDDVRSVKKELKEIKESKT